MEEYISSCCKCSYIWKEEIYGICDNCKNCCEIIQIKKMGEYIHFKE